MTAAPVGHVRGRTDSAWHAHGGAYPFGHRQVQTSRSLPPAPATSPASESRAEERAVPAVE
jgi:hypothetical protein